MSMNRGSSRGPTPFETTRAMSTVALLTDAFRRYLDHNKCECIPKDSEELDQFSSELLDHVIVVGGFCRDILLNRKINDIDIIINLRELTKLQTNHLKKYHSKRENQGRDIKCAYWSRYMAKMCPHAGKINEEQKHNPEIQMMHNFNFILNADFWISILRKDKRFDNLLSTVDQDTKGFISCEIVNDLKYGDVNLNHQKIDIIDTFHVDRSPEDHDMFDSEQIKQIHRKSRQLSMSGMDIESMGAAAMASVDNMGGGDDDDDDDDDYKDSSERGSKSRPEVDTEPARKPRKNRLKSMIIQQPDIGDLGNDFGNFGGFNKGDSDKQQYVVLEVPIYSGKVRYKLLNYDFSINTCILPLSNVLQLMQYNNEYDHTINGNEHNQPLTWKDVIENGLGECDGMEDCTQDKVLRSPEHDHCSIEAHPKTFIFWRIVRWLIREPDFKLDSKLKKAQMNDFQTWLNADWMGNTENCEKFMKYLQNTLENECNSIDDVQQMLTVMDSMRFHKVFKPILQSTPSVMNALTETLSKVNNAVLLNEKIAETFMATPYDYPRVQIEATSKSGPDPKIKELTQRNAALEEESNSNKAWVQKLEDQASRLLEEKKKIQAQLNRAKDDLSKAHKDLSETKQELEALAKSKKDLAISTDNTINELRGYLLKYQQALKQANVSSTTQ